MTLCTPESKMRIYKLTAWCNNCKPILTEYYVSGTVLGMWDMLLKKTDNESLLLRRYNSWDEGGKEAISQQL